MPDFWRHSGFHLMQRVRTGECEVSDDLLRAYFARPEVVPPPDAGDAERALFARLQRDPRSAVTPDELDAIEEADARDNYGILLRWREHLLGAGTVEEAYRRLFVGSGGEVLDFAALRIPPLFADQLAQIILRNALDDCDDPFVLRVAETFFREQVARVVDGQILLADLETIEATRHDTGAEPGGLRELVAQAVQVPAEAVIEVLSEDNVELYWQRDERHDFALNLDFGRRGLSALCAVVASWVRHMVGVELRVTPLRSIDSAGMRWYVGLDARATGLLNDLYNARPPDEATRSALLCVLETRLPEHPGIWPEARGARCHFALCMSRDGIVRIKPQNLLLNLPFGKCA